MAEKVREDRIHRAGWKLERVIWSDFDRPRQLSARIVQAVRGPG